MRLMTPNTLEIHDCSTSCKRLIALPHSSSLPMTVTALAVRASDSTTPSAMMAPSPIIALINANAFADLDIRHNDGLVDLAVDAGLHAMEQHRALHESLRRYSLP